MAMESESYSSLAAGFCFFFFGTLLFLLHSCFSGGLERVVQLLLLIASNSAPFGWIGRGILHSAVLQTKECLLMKAQHSNHAWRSVWMSDAKERPTPHQRILSSSQLHVDYLTRSSLLIERCFHCKMTVWPLAYKSLQFFNADVLVICHLQVVTLTKSQIQSTQAHCGVEGGEKQCIQYQEQQFSFCTECDESGIIQKFCLFFALFFFFLR